jgi:hypothetical protein
MVKNNARDLDRQGPAKGRLRPGDRELYHRGRPTAQPPAWIATPQARLAMTILEREFPGVA